LLVLKKTVYTFRHSTNGEDQGFFLDDLFAPCTNGYLDNGEYCPLCNPKGDNDVLDCCDWLES
jgi:hypothetical protein